MAPLRAGPPTRTAALGSHSGSRSRACLAGRVPRTGRSYLRATDPGTRVSVSTFVILRIDVVECRAPHAAGHPSCLCEL